MFSESLSAAPKSSEATSPGPRSPGPRSPGPSVLQSAGRRVRVSTVDIQDVEPYRRAVEASRERLARWNPVDPDDLVRHIERQSVDRRTFLIHALAAEGDHDIVGKVNVTDVVRGRFESAALGYDAYDPYAGRGLFAEGLRLVLDLAFTPETAGGMGLHRVAASVQPGNVRSAGLLRSLGFQREGFSPGLLWLPGPDGDAWRDHDSYAVRAEEWPSRPYPMTPGRTILALVNGPPSPVRTALARALAAELRIPLFCRDLLSGHVHSGHVHFGHVHSGDVRSGHVLSRAVIKESGADALWARLADSPVGGVVEGWFRPADIPMVVEGLGRCGLDPSAVPEVWCSSAAEVEKPPQPLGLGPTVAPASKANERADIVRMALEVGAASAE